MSNTIKLTDNNYNEFRRLYSEAKQYADDDFEFDGQTVLTSYAKYVIEFYQQEKARDDGR